MSARKTVTVDCEDVLAVTDRAVLLLLSDDREVWFPLSQCEDLEDVAKGDGEGCFECPEWLADEKGVP